MTNDMDIRKWMDNVVDIIINYELKMQDELLRIIGYNDNDQTILSRRTNVTKDYIHSMKQLLAINNDNNNRIYFHIS